MNNEYYQIGDFVYVDLRVFLNGEYLLAKVVEVNGEDNTVKVVTCKGKEFSYTFNMNKENMLTPIPISEDLLEALGITDQSDNKCGDYRTGIYLSVLMPGGLLMWNDFGIRRVKYLHELQHTMRGLGLPEINYSKLLNYVDKRKN